MKIRLNLGCSTLLLGCFLSILFITNSFGQRALIRRVELLNVVQRSTIQSSLVDSKGRLWLGMPEGLCMYNGVEARIFSKLDSLEDLSVTAIAESKDGTLWFGHENGKVTIFKNNKFSGFRPKEGVPKKSISDILISTDGSVCFATDSIGFWYYSGGRMYMISEGDGLLNPSLNAGQSTTSEDFGDLIPGLEGDISLGKKSVEIYCLYQDPKTGIIWLGTDAGIVQIDLKKKGTARFSYLSMKEGLQDNIVKKIVRYGEHQLLLSLGTTGLGVYDLKTKAFSLFPGWDYGAVSTMYYSTAGNLWVGSQNGALYQYNPKLQKFKLKPQVDKQIVSIVEDKEGNLFLGSIKGVFEYSGNRFSFISPADGLAEATVLSLYQDSQGYVWAGTPNGLFKISIQPDGQIAVTPTPLNGLMKGVQVVRILEDKFKQLWIGTLGAGVFRLNPDNLTATNYSTNGTITSKDIYALAVDSKDNIFIGTFGAGVYQVALLANGIGPVKHFNSEDGFGGDYVYFLHVDKKGTLWIATDGKSVFSYNGQQFRNYTEKEGLASRTIYSIGEDSKGHLWFGTADIGIVKYDGKRFTIYDYRNGLRDDSPAAMVCDANNHVLIAHRYGIDEYSVDSSRFKYFGETDGLVNFEPQQNAVYLDANGSVWIGTNNGIVIYNTKSTLPKRVPPQLSINRLRIFLKDVPMVEGFEFSYRENHVTFDFVGISLSSPGNVKYKFMLEGYETDWSLETDVRYHTYSNLPPGSYIFRVRAYNAEGLYSESSYKFEVRPPFWQTWWFITLSILSIVLGAYFYFKWRIKKIESEKRILELKVQERTQEIMHQKEIIEEKNKDITESIEYAKRLQFAILPEKELINQSFPDCFVFYRPKDIVSGDFYWFNRKDNHAVIAAVDCTGHGVPGAFMSVMGYSQLNEVFNFVKETDVDPAELLSMVDLRVRVALKQDSATSGTKDGMDVSLCVVDLDQGLLKYSGAYRPMFFVRGTELKEFKGDKFPIGGSQMEFKTFTSESIPLEDGDSIYIFSDGFVDQFGGPNHRKFTPKRLKELLLANQHLTMDEQYVIIERAFNEWLEGHAQIDDVMLIGIRYHKNMKTVQIPV